MDKQTKGAWRTIYLGERLEGKKLLRLIPVLHDDLVPHRDFLANPKALTLKIYDGNKAYKLTNGKTWASSLRSLQPQDNVLDYILGRLGDLFITFDIDGDLRRQGHHWFLKATKLSTLTCTDRATNRSPTGRIRNPGHVGNHHALLSGADGLNHIDIFLAAAAIGYKVVGIRYTNEYIAAATTSSGEIKTDQNGHPYAPDNEHGLRSFEYTIRSGFRPHELGIAEILRLPLPTAVYYPFQYYGHVAD